MTTAEPTHLKALLPGADCARWLAAFDQADLTLPQGHPDRQPTSGSLRLRAVVGSDFSAAWALLQPLADTLFDAPPAPQLLADQCWLRCQYPPAARPAGQHPHSWHQDGALGCRFDGTEALAELRTLWVPLVDCGDTAPSLQWVATPTPRLLAPHELTAAAVLAAHGAAALRHARLAAGDALLFNGALLHRTHVAEGMTRRRVSLELRVVQRLPARLAHEHAGPLPSANPAARSV